MSLQAPRNAYEAAWQKWNYGGGGRRGEPMPETDDYPDSPMPNFSLTSMPEDELDPMLVGQQRPGVSVAQGASLGDILGWDNPANATVGGGAGLSTEGAWSGPEDMKYTGFNPKYAYEGFDFGREQNPQKSAKDAFAFYANQAPPPPTSDKAALGAWFSRYIKPGMEKLGHRITGVTGDQFGLSNWQGNFNIDYARGAGAPGSALTWQAGRR